MAKQATTIPDLEHEPALSIGELVADKAATKALIGAVLGIIAAVGINVAPGVEDNIVTIVTTLVPIVLAYAGLRAMQTQARQQALDTRALVYSPASVRKLEDDIAEAS